MRQRTPGFQAARLTATTLIALVLLCTGSLLAQPVDPCNMAQSSTYGCWESIEPICELDSVACANGFPFLEAVHSILTYDGSVARVLMFASTRPYRPSPRSLGFGAVLWNPETKAGTRHVVDSDPDVPGVHDDLFCSGHAVLDDGRVLFVGGTHYPAPALDCPDQNAGHDAAWTFDPKNPGFTKVAHMFYPRYYPAATVLPTGHVLVTSGGDCDITAEIPEIYDPYGGPTGNWTRLPSARSNRYGWPWYPFMHVLTSGKVLYAGPFRGHDHASKSDGPRLQTLDPVPGATWQDFGESAIDGAGSAMYQSGNAVTGRVGWILKTGRLWVDRPNLSSRAEIISEDGARLEVEPLYEARFNHNHVILPDGKVLVTGGQTANLYFLDRAVVGTELWDPQDKTWSRLAPSPTDRMYHSTAILLPDARVLSAGGQFVTTNAVGDTIVEVNRNGDFFSPPYLFKNDMPLRDQERPVIVEAPELIACGSEFALTVSVPTGTAIAKACLVRPAATTHGNDMEQRYVPLAFSAGSDGALTLTAPATAAEAPPGYYMLFVLNDDDGILRPSRARFVRVWGIVETSIQQSATRACGDEDDALFELDVSWETNLAADWARLEVCPPDVDCDVEAPRVVEVTTSGKRHRVTFAAPCQAGGWQYTIESGAGTSVSRSVPRVVEVVAEPTCVQCPASANAHPNPFGESVTIDFAVPRGGPVELAIFDVAGRRVRSLVKQTFPAGGYQRIWDGRDHQGREMVAGIYFAKMRVGDQLVVQKLVLAR